MSRNAIVLASLCMGCADRPPEPDAWGGPTSVVVQGRWTLEVRQPDGALVQRSVFDNAFVGGPILTGFLARDATNGPWMVQLQGSDQPCLEGSETACLLGEPDVPLPESASLSKNLTVDHTGGALILAGSILADGGVVDQVQTLVGECDPVVDAAACGADPSLTYRGAFTTHDLLPAEQITVGIGQQIMASVEIVFETAP